MEVVTPMIRMSPDWRHRRFSSVGATSASLVDEVELLRVVHLFLRSSTAFATSGIFGARFSWLARSGGTKKPSAFSSLLNSSVRSIFQSKEEAEADEDDGRPSTDAGAALDVDDVTSAPFVPAPPARICSSGAELPGGGASTNFCRATTSSSAASDRVIVLETVSARSPRAVQVCVTTSPSEAKVLDGFPCAVSVRSTPATTVEGAPLGVASACSLPVPLVLLFVFSFCSRLSFRSRFLRVESSSSTILRPPLMK
mmetsp:Transcript_6181/g.15338  ORF Transcript_6181/g.15338 Transcript_6181/m.15338 type:complete len:255 (-) Transcript_6181:1616-2380(-)